MKTFVKIFRGKMSYTKIDKYVDLVRRTLDPDDYFNIEIQYDDGWQYIKIEVWDRVYYQKQRRYMKLTETTVKTITSKYRDI